MKNNYYERNKYILFSFSCYSRDALEFVQRKTESPSSFLPSFLPSLLPSFLPSERFQARGWLCTAREPLHASSTRPPRVHSSRRKSTARLSPVKGTGLRPPLAGAARPLDRLQVALVWGSKRGMDDSGIHPHVGTVWTPVPHHEREVKRRAAVGMSHPFTY